MPVDYIPPHARAIQRVHALSMGRERDPPPWTPLAKPLAQCKVAVMSSGGILYRDQPRSIVRTRATGSYRKRRGATN